MITLTLFLHGRPVIRSKPIASADEAAARIAKWQATYLRIGAVQVEEGNAAPYVWPSAINPTVRLPE